MEKKYKVSIVLPVYNGEKYLPLAIESIIQQTYQNFELIVIDDCSTDQSYCIAKSYAKKDSRIRVYKNRENKKLPRSLNAGFHMASGDLLTWTSDDNILKPEMLETLVNVFKENPDIDFVYADIIPIDEYGNIMKTQYLNGEIEDIYVFNPVLACFLYKKKIHEVLKGYDPKKYLYEDYDFWLRAYEYGFKMFHLKKKLYFYRLHSGSLTAQKRKEKAIIKLKRSFKHLFKNTTMSNKKKLLVRMRDALRELASIRKQERKSAKSYK